MKEQLGSERRIHPRIDSRLPVKIAVNGYDFTTNTQNISRAGAYCCIGKYIPPFTKVSVRLKFCTLNENKKKDICVECRGVVVRSEDSQDGAFNIAIFFNDIRESESKKLVQYLNQFLPEAVTQN